MTEFTYGRFISQVKNRTAGDTWIVLFYKENHDPSKDLLNKLTQTATMSDKTLRFGVVNVEKQVQLAEDCGVLTRQVPKIIIYHSEGKTEYVASKKPDEMYKRFLAFIPNLAEEVKNNWIEEHRDKIAAVLFTKNQTVPPLWRAIAGKFKNSEISIGFCTNYDIMDSYNVCELPAIVFFNSTASVTYEGKHKFKKLTNAITQFSHGRFFQAPVVQSTDYFFSDEFEKECLGGRTLCVAHAVDDLNPQLDSARTKLSTTRAKWFYGRDFPLRFVLDGDLWVVDPRRRAATKATFAGLGDILEGKAEWKSFDTLQNSDL